MSASARDNSHHDASRDTSARCADRKMRSDIAHEDTLIRLALGPCGGQETGPFRMVIEIEAIAVLNRQRLGAKTNPFDPGWRRGYLESRQRV